MSSYTEGLHITDNPACNEFMRGEWGDFPRIQFDRKLGAELTSDEATDINEEALRETLEKIGAPEERWGGIVLTVASNKKSPHLPDNLAGSTDTTEDGGFEVAVRAGDFNTVLRHELKHVKDEIEKGAPQRNETLYKMGKSALVKETFSFALATVIAGGLITISTESGAADYLVNASCAVTASFCLASLGVYLAGYHWDERERRARKAEKAFETEPVLIVNKEGA